MSENRPGRRQALTAVVLLVVCALSFGLMAIVSKIALLNGGSPEAVMVIRSATAAIVIAASLGLSKGKFALPRQLIARAIVAIGAAALMAYFSLWSLLYIDVGLSILVLFAYPFLVALYYHLCGTAPLGRAGLFWSLTAFVGLGLALSVNFSTLNKTGLALAGASALFATLMVISIVKVSRELGGMTTSFYLAVGAFVMFGVWTLARGNAQLPVNTTGWLAAIGAGLAFAIIYVTFLIAVRLIGPTRASMITFLEPIAAILLAAAVFSERLTLVQWAGVTLVAVGLVMLEAPDGWWRRKPAPP
jgi:drug/metabolite transporter (DMT)-like permease